MRKIKQQPFNRSGTTGGLPNIGVHNVRSDNKNYFYPKSTYLDSIDK